MRNESTRTTGGSSTVVLVPQLRVLEGSGFDAYGIERSLYTRNNICLCYAAKHWAAISVISKTFIPTDDFCIRT